MNCKTCGYEHGDAPHWHQKKAALKIVLASGMTRNFYRIMVQLLGRDFIRYAL